MSKQDFTDLVLLIGTNPLPNYVVAKFFHLTNKNLQRIWLIHSEETKFSQGTGRYAENIENVLRNECLFSSIQTIVPITSGQAFLKYPDTVPAASGHHYRMIRPTAGTLCLKFNIDN